MNYKLKGAIRRNRNRFIIFGLLWVILFMVMISPLACMITDATANGGFSLSDFLTSAGKYISNPFRTVGIAFGDKYAPNLGSFTIYFTVVYLFFVIWGIIKSAPKNEYSDIEHGSSDWSERGEQYKVLSKTEGIILAEEHYLPLNKMGNINVLIVGRIRFW